MKSRLLPFLVIGLLSATSLVPGAAQDPEQPTAAQWQPLFNGVDFTGWDTYLGPPQKALFKPADGVKPYGINYDPRNVFTTCTVDGHAAIRVSGEIWGVLSSKQEFENYHFRVEYKWGSKVWPPLNARDSGIMYHARPPHGLFTAGGYTLADPPGSGFFDDCAEYQIATGNVGMCCGIGNTAFEASSPKFSGEFSRGWNTIDIICTGDSSTHLLNGTTITQVLHFTRRSHALRTPLTKGNIQLQSESAEIFFRNPQIRLTDRPKP